LGGWQVNSFVLTLTFSHLDSKRPIVNIDPLETILKITAVLFLANFYFAKYSRPCDLKFRNRITIHSWGKFESQANKILTSSIREDFGINPFAASSIFLKIIKINMIVLTFSFSLQHMNSLELEVYNYQIKSKNKIWMI
jgi:hypothetical protein